jgi:hypothetical protein
MGNRKEPYRPIASNLIFKRKGPKMGNADAAVNLALMEQERVQACRNEIDEALKKYGCLLDPQVMITSKGTRIMVNIVPNPKFMVPPPIMTPGAKGN